MTHNPKGLIINMCLLACCMIICLCCLEVFLRFLGYKALPNFAVESRYYFKPDNETGFDIQQNHPSVTIQIEGNYCHDVWSNELGCFDTPYEGEQDSILLLGDSFTHMFAPFECKWGTVMQTMLGHRVLKCGVVGYGTRQQYLKAKKIVSQLKSPPKLIIVGYFSNDLYEDYAFPSTTVQDGLLVSFKYISDMQTGIVVESTLSDRMAQVQGYEKNNRTGSSLFGALRGWWFNNSAIYAAIETARRKTGEGLSSRGPAGGGADKDRLLSATFYYSIGILPEQTYPWMRNAWDVHFNSVLSFKRLADELGSKLLFVIIPTKQEVYCPEWLQSNGIDLDTPRQKLLDFLGSEQILYLDLLPHLQSYRRDGIKTLDPEKDLYWHNDSHFTARGNYLTGLLVSDFIIRQGIVDIPDKNHSLAGIEERLAEFK